MDKRILLLHLSLIKKVSQQTLLRLAKVVMSDKQPERWYTMRTAHFQRLGASETAAQLLVDGLADVALVQRELALIQQHTVSWITLYDDEYPQALKAIHIPPLILYWQGAVLWHTQKACAIVGARKGDVYGKAAVEHLVPALVQQQWVIVSGGAYGIDAYAHQATMTTGGKTIVVVGSGLLKPYPAGHKKLYQQILHAGGMIVSACALKEEATPWSFPERNRIIAGLSQACIVVQAAEKSGALITAYHALQEGRLVGAIPGPFYSTLSKGCHTLLQEGAKLVTCADDITQEFELVQRSCLQEQLEATDSADDIGTEKVNMLVKEPLINISEHQQENFTEILSCIDNDDHKTTKAEDITTTLLARCITPLSITQLVEQTGLAEQMVSDILFDAQLDGKVQQDFAGMWSLK